VPRKKQARNTPPAPITDLYYYDVTSHRTENWTAGMPGYDTQPSFSPDGNRIAWVSMAHDGYESDKADLIVMDLHGSKPWKVNVTINGMVL